MFKNSWLTFHFSLALIVRIIFTLVGIYLDSKATLLNDNGIIPPKYTDVDYQVFTDAANHVYNGQSPYERDTYRYTPILAILLLPNIFLTNTFGKFLFVIFDLLCGYLIYRINSINGHSTDLKSILFWFYNPITIAISSRGNAESVMACLVLAFIYFLRSDQFAIAGLLYGLSIHFKIYPLIYTFAIVLYIIKPTLVTLANSPYKLILNKNLFKFGLTSLILLTVLTGGFYLIYGWQFLQEAYLYHVTRQDIRHNFSPYFYLLYLTDQTWESSNILKIFYFVPQLVFILVTSAAFFDELELCLLCLTYLFVSFNKVCTSQYFVWYLCLIPLVIPRLKMHMIKGAGLFAVWMFSQVLWLYFAFQIEFMGRNRYFEVCLAGLFYLIINCLILRCCIIGPYECAYIRARNIKNTPKDKIN